MKKLQLAACFSLLAFSLTGYAQPNIFGWEIVTHAKKSFSYGFTEGESYGSGESYSWPESDLADAGDQVNSGWGILKEKNNTFTFSIPWVISENQPLENCKITSSPGIKGEYFKVILTETTAPHSAKRIFSCQIVQVQ